MAERPWKVPKRTESPLYTRDNQLYEKVYTPNLGWSERNISDVDYGSAARKTAKSVLDADLEEAKLRQQQAVSLSTKQRYENALAENARRMNLESVVKNPYARLRSPLISDTSVDTSSNNSSGSSRGTEQTEDAPKVSPQLQAALTASPNFETAKPLMDLSADWITDTRSPFQRVATRTIKNRKPSDFVKANAETVSRGGGIAMSESGKVIRIDPTPKFAGEENLTPDEIQVLRPFLEAAQQTDIKTKEAEAKAAKVKADMDAYTANKDYTDALVEYAKSVSPVYVKAIEDLGKQQEALAAVKIDPEDIRQQEAHAKQVRAIQAQRRALLDELGALRPRTEADKAAMAEQLKQLAALAEAEEKQALKTRRLQAYNERVDEVIRSYEDPEEKKAARDMEEYKKRTRGRLLGREPLSSPKKPVSGAALSQDSVHKEILRLQKLADKNPELYETPEFKAKLAEYGKANLAEYGKANLETYFPDRLTEYGIKKRGAALTSAIEHTKELQEAARAQAEKDEELMRRNAKARRRLK